MVKRHGHKEAVFVPDAASAGEALLSRVRPGDMVITMGAGDIFKAGRRLLEKL
jgi:UDP-N-acetylmuramate--alanine ligase